MASGFNRGALIIDDAAQSRINLGLQIGVDVQAWSDELDGLSLLNTTGFVVRTANGTYAIREFIEGSGITITNPDGVSGNPTFTSFGGSGNVNSVSGTLNRIDVEGTASDPIIDISASYVGQASITTLGTIATGTWTATTIGVVYGGTGLTTIAQGDILYGSASNVISKLSKNTTAKRYLANTGTNNNPNWDTVDLTNGVSGILPLANGGLGVALVDPDEDKIVFWDDSEGELAFLTIGSNLSIDGTTLNASTGSSGFINSTQEYFDDLISESFEVVGQIPSDPFFLWRSGWNTVNQHVSESNRPGVCSFTSTSGTTQCKNYSTRWLVTPSLYEIEVTWNTKIQTLSATNPNYVIYQGIWNQDDNPTSNNRDGLYFQYTHGTNSGRWQIVTRSSGVATVTNTTSVVDTSWHQFKITINAAGTQVRFYIDGVEVTGSPIATNIPQTDLGWRYYVNSVSGSTNKTFFLDYIFAKLNYVRSV